MGLPSIDISFQTAAQATIAMGDKGYVGVIVRDTAQAGAHYLPRVGKIPRGAGRGQSRLPDAHLPRLHQPA